MNFVSPGVARVCGAIPVGCMILLAAMLAVSIAVGPGRLSGRCLRNRVLERFRGYRLVTPRKAGWASSNDLADQQFRARPAVPVLY